MAGAVGFFALLTLDRLRLTSGLDATVSRWLDTHDPNRFDPVAKAISVSGQSSVIGLATAALAVVLWRRGPRWAWLAPLAVGLTAVVELVAKQPLVPPPPPGDYLRAALDALAGLEVGSSFPSGHVARVACLALIAASISRRTTWRVAMAAVIVLSFAGRTYAGGHTIADTIGGLALGLSAGSVGIAWLHRVGSVVGARGAVRDAHAGAGRGTARRQDRSA